MLYKRSKKPGAVYWTRFTIRGREIRVSTGTSRKALAEEFERRLRDQIWREKELGEVAYTWDDAKERWLKDKASKRSLQRDKVAFAAVGPVLDGQFIVDINDDKIDETIEHLTKAGLAPGGINRNMACVRSVLNRARKKWKWDFTVPIIEALPVEDHPPRWERPERVAKLLTELPDHARAIVRFAVAAGPRSGNIFRLRWDRVDFDSRCYWVEGRDHKGKRTVGFPLSQEAISILREQVGKHEEYVFPDHMGRAPIGSIKTCWKKACQRAGLPGFRVHDLRHTWAAWHKLKGTPDRAIKELGGWSTMQMLERYGHINPQDYAMFADNLPTKNGTRPTSTSRKRR